MNELINTKNLILENEVFSKNEIEKRMIDGGFKSIAKFELFIWDLEIFLQIQKILGDKIILKGGAIVNRDKAEWSIVGYQLELIVELLYNGNQQIRKIRDIEELLTKLNN